ncbi:hypothetical protein Lal_00039660 [Lupinus albus]|nr:hypothetical protein Lal_00039660 [Lupinus albus]
MASSSKRPRTSKSKQGESSSKSNPLNLTRLLANDGQRKQQKLFGFSCEANYIYPELVGVLYCNMNFRKNLMTSHVKGKDIVLDIQTFSSICCDIPMTGEITGFGLINWTKMIMQQMWHVRGSQSPLPYAIFIIKIHEHFGVSLDGETKLALNLRESMVDIEPESHASSSSSAAMPTNQMIMDELVSLRRYITTRMDAFDTQSQQIHYELHRLSSRLSNMDVDEDSSEPES